MSLKAVNTKATAQSAARTLAPRHRPPTLVIVPTMFFREHPELGGDGALIAQVAERVGVPTLRAPVLSLGSVAENTARLLEALSKVEGPFWVATLSKGGLEMKEALRTAGGGDVFSRLRGWVNISGALGGSRIVDCYRASTHKKQTGTDRSAIRYPRITIYQA